MAGDFEIIGLKELRAAVSRNPRRVLDESRNFLQRGLAKYKSGINNNPWRLGSSGGGAPVASGNLRDTHRTRIGGLEGEIYPTAPYASYVHGIKGWPRKRSYQLRPWLDYVKKNQDGAIQTLYRQLLGNIVKDLAS